MPLLTVPSSSRTVWWSKAWLYVFMLAVVGCLNYIDRTMITTMRSSITSAIPMSDAQFGLLTAVFLWIYGILSPVGGYLADRFSRSKVIIISLFIWSVTTWLTAYTTTFGELLATRAIMGISEACYMPAALALITGYHRGPTRSLAIGINMAGVIAGQGLGFVGGWMAERHAWNDAFYVFGAGGVVYAIVLAMILKDAPALTIEEKDLTQAGKTINEKISFINALRDLFRSRSFIILLSSWGLLGIVGWIIIGWLPTYYKEQFNLSQTLAGLYATGYLNIASILGVIAGGKISDKWSRQNIRARIWVPVIGLLLASIGVFIAMQTNILTVALAAFTLYGFTKFFADVNMMPILCLIANPKFRATGYGVLNLFSCIIGGIGLYAAGALRDLHINLSIMFFIAASAIIICAVLLLLIKFEAIEEK